MRWRKLALTKVSRVAAAATCQAGDRLESEVGVEGNRRQQDLLDMLEILGLRSLHSLLVLVDVLRLPGLPGSMLLVLRSVLPVLSVLAFSLNLAVAKAQASETPRISMGLENMVCFGSRYTADRFDKDYEDLDQI